MQRGVETIRSTAERAMGQVRSTAGDVSRATGTGSSSPGGSL